jgi:hypothetical protein
MQFISSLSEKLISSLYRRPSLAFICILSITLVGVDCLLQGNIGVNLADEGFLWYGTVQTALGKIPVQDFQSYDPGRYYWGAFWLRLFNDESLMVLRLSNAIFQVLGLVSASLVLRRLIHNPFLLLLVIFLLMLWMYPRHKLFDITISLAAVYFGVLLIEQPSLYRHFWIGVFVGFCAFWGRNHGFYTFLSFLLLIGVICFRFDYLVRPIALIRRFFYYGMGILVGYSPMFLMMAFISGFLESFLDKNIGRLARLGANTLSTDTPWFWIFDYSKLDALTSLHYFSVGFLFFVLPLFNLISLFLISCSAQNSLILNPVIVSSTLMSLTYTHYAFSRADLAHLTQGIHPMLIGLIGYGAIGYLFLRRWVVNILFGLLLLILCFGIVPATPLGLMSQAPKGSYVQHMVGSDRLWIPRETADLVNAVTKINEAIPKQDGLLLAPYIPALYPALNRQSPLWDIYILFPELEERQQDMIKELNYKRVNWVILGDVTIDNRDDLRFKNTHSLIWRHFQEDFIVVENTLLPANYQLLRRKELIY